jgi:hypothetical protein
MIKGFRFQISVDLKGLVSPMPKGILMLLLFIDCNNVRHENIELSTSEDI